MTWLKTIPILGDLALKGVELWERRQAAKASQERETKYERIKANSSDRHSELFGDASGRMRVDKDTDSSG